MTSTTSSVSSETSPITSWEPRIVQRAEGLLAEANAAGLVAAADVHVARTIGRLSGESDDQVLFAIAMTVRAVGEGSVCVDVRQLPEIDPDFAWWPDPDEWVAAIRRSPAVAVLGTGEPDASSPEVELAPSAEHARALILDRDLLYLDRYHRLEREVWAQLRTRAAPSTTAQDDLISSTLTRLFPEPGYGEQVSAIKRTMGQRIAVITGGPGTGKTTAVAGFLATLLAVQADADSEQQARFSIALAAPTGKAAARLAEAVAGEAARFPDADRARLTALPATTLHRLLGWRADNQTRFRHDRHNRLKHDVVVVDEASMVDLTMMARLLEALRPEARLVLVGDADQLTSVAAGAVLSDLVRGYGTGPDSPVTALQTTHRFGAEIGAFAEALRRGDADEAIACLRRGDDQVEFVETTDAADAAAALRPELLAHALRLRQTALTGDPAAAVAVLDEHRLICAHRDGPHGVSHFNRLVERWLAESEGRDYWPPNYAGRPLLITKNDLALGVYNGESGVVVADPAGPTDGRRPSLRGFVATAGGLRDFATTRLSEAETMHALTVHKSQGSQADRVTVLLPPVDSRLLTRELFYTAVTRARHQVRVVGSEDEVRAAVARTARRATGLADRLADGG